VRLGELAGSVVGAHQELAAENRLSLRAVLAHGGGVGPGLSIVRSITAAHGGTVGAQPRVGGGLIVQIELPASSDAGHRPGP
jgi:K+-sensing histidine kinase KdpD